MVNTLVTVRTARARDAAEIANVHDLSWREAYRGIIPGSELEKMISRRGQRWWESAIKRGSNILVLDFDESVVGYTTYGRNRAKSIPYKGEIYELYLIPEFQGLGFGRRLFKGARADLARHNCDTAVVWSLEENDRAVAFYRHLGGTSVKRAPEKFGEETRDRIAFGFE
jgi:ribosomal protein S18 acetylase RimI-like enzyme